MATSKTRKPPRNRLARRRGRNPDVHVGKSHAGRFVEYGDLPKNVQRENDWAEDGDEDGNPHKFVRVKYGDEWEFIPFENFEYARDGKAPSGTPADGFFADSYFTGLAIKLMDPLRSTHDYAVWHESW